MEQGEGGSVLIVGATGVVGRAALEAYEADNRWTVTGLSRKQPTFDTAAQWVTADLMKDDDLAERLAAVGPISHVVYTALQEEPSLVSGWTSQNQISSNTEMLRRLLDAAGQSVGGPAESTDRRACWTGRCRW